MNKKEYLPFHAKTLIDLSNQLKLKLYWANGENDNSITFDHYSYYNRESNTLLTNENELLNALNQKAKNDFTYKYDFLSKYLNHVLLSGTDEQIAFFVVYNGSLVGSYSLAEINKLIPKLNEKTVETIFKKGSSTMGTNPSSDIENTIKLLEKHPMQAELISTFLGKYGKQLHERLWFEVRDIILKYFSNNLEQFNNLPVIKEYIDSLSNKEDPFIDTGISNTIYLRIDCRILKSSYPLSNGTLDLYTSTLETLIKSLANNESNTGVVKVHVQKSMPNKEYQYTHLYINLNESSSLTQQDVKKLIHDYYDDGLKNIFKEHKTWDFRSDYLVNATNKWSKSKIIYDKLEDNLTSKHSISKSHKI